MAVKTKKTEEEANKPVPKTEADLLKEIRDLLKAQKETKK